MWKTWKVVEANWELVEASGSCGRRQEAVEDMWEIGKGSLAEGVQEVRERCGRSGRGLEEVRKAVGKCRRDVKAQEVTLHYTTA